MINIIKQAKIEGKKHTNWIGKIVTAKNENSLHNTIEKIFRH